MKVSELELEVPLCDELLVCVLSGTWCDQSKFSAKQANHAANKVMEIEAHVTQHFSSNRDIWPLKETWQLTYLIFPLWISWSTRLVWITLTPHEWIGREINQARFKKKKKMDAQRRKERLSHPLLGSPSSPSTEAILVCDCMHNLAA